MSKYEVIVGNIGTVHEGTNPVEATRVYGVYKEQSESGKGRAGGEDITIFRDGEPWLEFEGSLSKEETVDADESGD